MKKNLWFVFVALAMVAIFAVAGCTPSTPTPSPTATPTAAPTVAPDTACPKVVSTVASKTYDKDYGTKAFQVVITFDEPISSGCIENPANWTLAVVNAKRNKSTFASTTGEKVVPYYIGISTDAKKVTLKAAVSEDMTYTVVYAVYNDEGGYTDVAFQVKKTFDGLLCSENDAKMYAQPDTKQEDAMAPSVATYNAKNYVKQRIGLPTQPTVADDVVWKLSNCVVCDDAGNCCCDYSGHDCCLEEVCPTCVTGCPLGSTGECL